MKKQNGRLSYSRAIKYIEPKLAAVANDNKKHHTYVLEPANDNEAIMEVMIIIE